MSLSNIKFPKRRSKPSPSEQEPLPGTFHSDSGITGTGYIAIQEVLSRPQVKPEIFGDSEDAFVTALRSIKKNTLSAAVSSIPEAVRMPA